MTTRAWTRSMKVKMVSRCSCSMLRRVWVWCVRRVIRGARRAAPPTPERVGVTRTGSGTYLPVSLGPTSLRRLVSGDGDRGFFVSSQPLVAEDTNQTQDVYEGEREGTAGCPVATSRYGGCVFLLSGANRSDLSFLVDASASGGDVFFTHRGQLGQAGDADHKTDLYDARVGGGFPVVSLACTGTGCQGVPPAPPIFATPSSVTFSGPGNFPVSVLGVVGKPLTAAQVRAEQLAKALKACRAKKNRHKRVVCEAQARKRYGPPARKKAGKAKGKKSSHAGRRGAR